MIGFSLARSRLRTSPLIKKAPAVSAHTDPLIIEAAMRKDPVYQHLFTALQEALASFDKSKDWPDFIKFLKNIQRVLLSCPHPELCPGHRPVHQSALDPT